MRERAGVTTGEPPAYLTTRELAGLLRLKERRVYELVARGEIPCVRATGRLLFPRAEVLRWLEGERAEGPPADVLAGSHDPLLEWALRESGSGIASFFDGSRDGLERLRDRRAAAAGVHLFDAAGGDWNLRAVREALGEAPVVVLEWAWRQRGLIVAAGNPHAVRGIADLRGLRVMGRQPGSGAGLLFAHLLREAGIAAGELELLPAAARTETELALAVAAGEADAGLGLACTARPLGLGFVPLLRERFDLVVDRRAFFEPPLQRLFGFARGAAFAARARELGGYDTAGLGRVHHNGP